MLFCQLTEADSLREISDGLYSSLEKLSHIGATAVFRSTLSYANSKRPYKLYGTFIKFSLRNSDTRYKGASETNSPNGLQLRFRNNKLMPSSVWMGSTPQAQRRNKTSYASDQQYVIAGSHRGNDGKDHWYQRSRRNIREHPSLLYCRYGSGQ